jgi:hypothetical protein
MVADGAGKGISPFAGSFFAQLSHIFTGLRKIVVIWAILGYNIMLHQIRRSNGKGNIIRTLPINII